MKKSFLLLPAFAVMAYVTLTSNSSGPGGNYTGSHGAAAGCTSGGSCHGATAVTGIKIGIELDSAGISVAKYVPGMTYTIKISDTNTTSSSLPKFGFQFSAVKGSGSTSTQAGTFSALPTGTTTGASSGLTIWGHNTSLSPTSGTGGTGTIYSKSVTWTAPAAGSGTVTMFAVMNDVNNDGSDSPADKWNTRSIAFPERPATTGIATTVDLNVAIFPNPTVNNVNIKMENAAAGTYTLRAFDLTGRIVASQQLEVTGNNFTTNINTTNWTPGMYNVVIEKDGSNKVIAVVKQ